MKENGNYYLYIFENITIIYMIEILMINVNNKC